jgi:hypothetical protein
MKKSELREIIKESNIRDDAKALLDQLIGLKLLKSGYATTTGNSARGKNKIIGTPNVEYNTFTPFNDAIKQNFKKVGSTSMSSAVFSNGIVHFFYYPSNSNRFDIVVRRKNYKGIKEMKKSELRQIIKEEISKVLKEGKDTYKLQDLVGKEFDVEVGSLQPRTCKVISVNGPKGEEIKVQWTDVPTKKTADYSIDEFEYMATIQISLNDINDVVDKLNNFPFSGSAVRRDNEIHYYLDDRNPDKEARAVKKLASSVGWKLKEDNDDILIFILK